MHRNETQLWSSVLTDLTRESDAESVYSWLEHVDVLACSDQEIVVRVPGAVAEQQLNALFDSVSRVCGTRPDVELQRNPSADQVTVRYVFNTQAIPSASAYLNDAHTFETFVAGDANRLAHAASMAVCGAPGEAYNPLIVAGETGQGKTHLLHAICQRILRNTPQMHLVFTTGDRLGVDLRLAAQHADESHLRARYLDAEMLVVDDLDSLPSDVSVQQAFLHLFDGLLHRGAQIVLSTSLPPAQLPFHDRLQARLMAGLVVPLENPDPAMRAALVRARAVRSGTSIADDVVNLIAERASGSSREVEGVVLKLIGLASVTHQPINASLVDEVLAVSAPSVRAMPSPVQLADISREICLTYNLSLRDLQSRSRARSVAFPRQLGMYLARVLTRHSLEEIGDYFGGRDHSTVKHAFDKVRDLVGKQADMSHLVKALRKRILGS